MTIRQARVIKLLSENVRISVSQAMILAGYSASSSRKPQRLTKSLAYLGYMEYSFPSEKLFEVHKDALNATKWERVIKRFVPDHSVRLRAVHDVYELKGLLPRRWEKK